MLENVRAAAAKVLTQPSTKAQQLADQVMKQELKKELLEWCERGLAETRYTQDYSKLVERTHWLLFNYDLFAAQDQQCIGFTDGKFRVWERSYGTAGQALIALAASPGDVEACSLPPWANPYGTGGYRRAPAARVRGVVQRIPTHEYLTLDRDMQNGIMFDRKRVNILVPETRIIRVKKLQEYGCFRQEMAVRTLQAWMYVGHPNYFDNEETGVDAGHLFSPAQLKHPESFWIQDFYTA